MNRKIWSPMSYPDSVYIAGDNIVDNTPPGGSIVSTIKDIQVTKNGANVVTPCEVNHNFRDLTKLGVFSPTDSLLLVQQNKDWIEPDPVSDPTIDLRKVILTKDFVFNPGSLLSPDPSTWVRHKDKVVNCDWYGYEYQIMQIGKEYMLEEYANYDFDYGGSSKTRNMGPRQFYGVILSIAQCAIFPNASMSVMSNSMLYLIISFGYGDYWTEHVATFLVKTKQIGEVVVVYFTFPFSLGAVFDVKMILGTTEYGRVELNPTQPLAFLTLDFDFLYKNSRL
jgi:hypothetical protein